MVRKKRGAGVGTEKPLIVLLVLFKKFEVGVSAAKFDDVERVADVRNELEDEWAVGVT